jgi:hypothetical protein
MVKLVTRSVLTLVLVGALVAQAWKAVPVVDPAWQRWRDVDRFPEGLASAPQPRDQAWWADTAGQIGATYWRTVDVANPARDAAEFVGLFGRPGTAFDLAWALADPDVFLVSFSNLSPRAAGRTACAKHWRALQLAAAEAQVRRFLREPDALRRYSDLVLFLEVAFPLDDHDGFVDALVASVERGLKDGDPSEFYWYARTIVFLCHLTGRDDLLKDVAPEEVGKAFDAWRRWLAGGGRARLRVDAARCRWVHDPAHDNRGTLADLSPPKVPFPDWTGAAPPRLYPVTRDYAVLPGVDAALSDVKKKLNRLNGQGP